MRRLAAALFITIAAASGMPEVRAQSLPAAGAWEIGPVVRGRNRSPGMPATPTPARRGWYFDFPYPTASAGHVHYITFPHGSLTGARRIMMRYRIDVAPGTRFVAQETPELPAALSLYFQRRGDSWTGRGPYAFYRWWSPRDRVVPLRPGEQVVSIDLDDEWVSIRGPRSAAPGAFQEALEEADRIGFVLGAADGGRGHGVYATGPARFTLLSYQVQ